eukprot:scaffold1872_cov262-Amphora_coffeaeformis.AAC.17
MERRLSSLPSVVVGSTTIDGSRATNERVRVTSCCPSTVRPYMDVVLEGGSSKVPPTRIRQHFTVRVRVLP